MSPDELRQRVELLEADVTRLRSANAELQRITAAVLDRCELFSARLAKLEGRRRTASERKLPARSEAA